MALNVILCPIAVNTPALPIKKNSSKTFGRRAKTKTALFFQKTNTNGSSVVFVQSLDNHLLFESIRSALIEKTANPYCVTDLGDISWDVSLS